MRMACQFLTSVLLVCAGALSAPAQIPLISNCPATAPISLTDGVIQTVAPNKVKPVVRVTNISAQPISAIFLRWRYVDANNKAVDAIASVDYATSGSLMQPKESLSMEGDNVVAPAATPGVFPVRRIEVSCETVLYGSTGEWGNLTLSGITDLLNERQGANMEREWLQATYKKEGLDGLLRELNRPVIRTSSLGVVYPKPPHHK